MKHPVEEIADAIGGKVTSAGILPDGSGFATIAMPLPKDHWLYADHANVPPMPFRVGYQHPQYEELNAKARAAARYAVRCATMNGKETDFDPDALVQNLLVGLLGYNTPDGLSRCDPESNPAPIPPIFDPIWRAPMKPTTDTDHGKRELPAEEGKPATTLRDVSYPTEAPRASAGVTPAMAEAGARALVEALQKAHIRPQDLPGRPQQWAEGVVTEVYAVMTGARR